MHESINGVVFQDEKGAPPVAGWMRDGARFWDLVAEFELSSTQIADTLNVSRGERAVLNTLAGHLPALPATPVSTSNAETYRGWIGGIEGEMPAHWRVPMAWSGRSVVHRDDLTEAERRDVEDAANIYFFGDPAHVATYRHAIESCYAPFDAVVYAVRRLKVEAGASLIITGAPTILLAESIELEQDGRLVVIDTPCRVHVGTLTKHGAPAASFN
ncbi:MAG: hypothetical protein P8011_09970 [Acidihalobacter sp.]